MNIIWLCITSVLSITSVFSDQNIDLSHLKVFPAMNKSIAGVLQVSYLKDLNDLQYAFNATEARGVCFSLGLIIASKAQVETALLRGLETCRFGWIDEHFAVIPRIQALANCGKNQTGMVPWRTPLHQKFDVFCFNESVHSAISIHILPNISKNVPVENIKDAEAQLKDAASDSPLSTSHYSGHTQSPSKAADSIRTTHTPTYSTPKITENVAELARFVDSARGPAVGRAVLISCTCAVLLIAVIIIAYLKLRRRHSRSADVKQQQERIQTEEWTCVKNITETRKDDQGDEGIEDSDNRH